jgi:hypothetical protein
MARKTYRVNADSWTGLRDLLVGSPEEFNAPSDTIRGRRIEHSHDISLGKLPEEWAIILRDDVVLYVIYSFKTPIAWYDERKSQWIVPAVRYSVTTSKHQNKVRTALSEMNADVCES